MSLVTDRRHTAETINAIAATTANPSDRQLAKSNYRMAHLTLHGLPITVENPLGSFRSGTAKDGTKWRTEMKAHYGYIRRTSDGTADGDHHDLFIGDKPEYSDVYVIDQVDPITGFFDEHKSVIGVANEQEAVSLYLGNYQPGWKGFGAITKLSIDGFKAFVANPLQSSRPLGPRVRVVQPMRYFTCRTPTCSYMTTAGTATDGVETVCPACGVSSMPELWTYIDKAEDLTQEDRDKMDDDVFAGPNKSFPVRNAHEVRAAWDLSGHADNPAQVRANIRSRAKKLGLETSLPDTANDSVSLDSYCPKCGEMYEWGGSACNRCGCDEYPLMEAYDGQAEECQEAYAMLRVMDSNETVSDAIQEEYEIIVDSNGTVRVRQLLMVANARNGNNRFYPDDVIRDAVMEARPRVRAGACLSEYIHPESVITDKGISKFVDNPGRKASRVEDIEGPDASGRVYVIFRTLDTECGRIVADSYRSGKPLGLSGRWGVAWDSARSKASGMNVAKKLFFSAPDHVPDPAFKATLDDWKVLTDSQLVDLGLIASSTTGRDFVDNALTVKMNRLKALVAIRAGSDKIKPVVDEIDSLIMDALGTDKPVPDDLLAAYTVIKDSVMSMPGYGAGKSPVGVPGDQTGTDFGDRPFKDAKVGDMNPTAMVAADPTKLQEASDAAAQAMIDAISLPKAKATNRTVLEAAFRSVFAGAYTAMTDDQKLSVVEPVLDRYDGAKGPGALDIKGAIKDMQAALDTIAEASTGAAAKAKLTAMGFDPTKLHHNTSNGVVNASTGAYRGPKWGSMVDKLCAAADNVARAASLSNPQVGLLADPDSPTVQGVREKNRPFIDTLLSQMVEKRESTRNLQQFIAACDSEGDGSDAELGLNANWDKFIQPTVDSTTLSNLYNQPAISATLLLQQFQNLQALNLVDPIGPAGGGRSNGNWFNITTGGQGSADIGSVLRIPVETVNAPGSTGNLLSGPQGGSSMHNAEGSPIDNYSFNIRWQVYGPSWWRVAGTVTAEARIQMGTGPLNYDVIGRQLFHMGFFKDRVIDKNLLDAMIDAADVPGAVAVVGESVDLTHNSVYGAGGSITVNLNPAKAANAAVVAGDPSITYGANVIGAVRLKAGVPITNSGAFIAGGLGAGTYFGTNHGPVPIVRPSVNQDILVTGQATVTANYLPVVTAPAAMYLGFYDDTFNIQSYYAGINGQSVAGVSNLYNGGGSSIVATFAVDFNNSVMVFSSGVTGSSNLLTTPVTVSYWYATNYDVWPNVIPSGQFAYQYYNSLLLQLDATSAYMASQARYVPANLCVSSFNASVPITGAEIFYKWQSPTGTLLYPSEMHYFTRNGINGVRVNAPWRIGDSRMYVGARGTTKYGVALPFQITGPYPAYDQASGKITAQNVFYGEEYSVICTPQVTDPNTPTTIINPVARSIQLSPL